MESCVLLKILVVDNKMKRVHPSLEKEDETFQ